MGRSIAGRRATRMASVVVNVTWWFGMVLAGALALSFLAAPVLHRADLVPQFHWSHFSVEEGDGAPRLATTVTIGGHSGSSVLPLTSGTDATLSSSTLRRDMRAVLEVGTQRWGFFYLAAAPLLAILAASLWCVYLLRAVLRDVLAENVFTERNAARLTALGWILLILGIIGPAVREWRTSLILRHVSIEGASLAPADTDASALWVVGLLLLALASAWRYGVELQRDRDLTV